MLIRAGVAILCLGFLTACPDRSTPAKSSSAAGGGAAVQLEPREITVTETSEVKLGFVGGADATFVVTPSDVAVVAVGGGLHCLKSGDATVALTSGSARAESRVRCRLVEALRGPDSYELTIPNAPVPIEVAALDAHGDSVPDVAPTLSMANARIATVQRGTLQPLSVGNTTLTAKLGSTSIQIPVRVIRKLQTNPILLNDGAKVDYALNQGRYRAEIKVRAANGARFGVTASWVGGDGCADEPESQNIVSTCTISDSGALIITNPTGFGFGPAEQGFVSLYQVPAE